MNFFRSFFEKFYHRENANPLKNDTIKSRKQLWLIDSANHMQELIDQVYQFSLIYWKSVKQQNLPVTITYPEMVAEMILKFEGNGISDFGKVNL